MVSLNKLRLGWFGLGVCVVWDLVQVRVGTYHVFVRIPCTFNFVCCCLLRCVCVCLPAKDLSVYYAGFGDARLSSNVAAGASSIWLDGQCYLQSGGCWLHWSTRGGGGPRNFFWDPILSFWSKLGTCLREGFLYSTPDTPKKILKEKFGGGGGEGGSMGLGGQFQI